MKRLSILTLVALAIVVGTTAQTLAQKKSVRLDPIKKDLYNLTYVNDGKRKVKVEVIDQNGINILSEQIKQEKSFTKSYNFQNLKLGEYSFKITDEEGQYVTKIKRTDEELMVAEVKKIEDTKAKIVVKGQFMTPVSVNIIDRHDVLVFDEYIDREKGFSKVYDLSKLNADQLRLEVVAGGSVLASSNF